MVPWSNSADRSNGRGAGEPIQGKRVESLPDTNLIYFPGLLRASPSSKMAQQQWVHFVKDGTKRTETLPYTQTDDKTNLCCRMPRLSDTDINNNIEAQSSFVTSFKQNPVERFGL